MVSSLSFACQGQQQGPRFSIEAAHNPDQLRIETCQAAKKGGGGARVSQRLLEAAPPDRIQGGDGRKQFGPFESLPLWRLGGDVAVDATGHVGRGGGGGGGRGGRRGAAA